MLAWNINEVHLSFSWCWSLEKAVLPWTGDWKGTGNRMAASASPFMAVTFLDIGGPAHSFFTRYRNLYVHM